MKIVGVTGRRASASFTADMTSKILNETKLTPDQLDKAVRAGRVTVAIVPEVQIDWDLVLIQKKSTLLRRIDEGDMFSPRAKHQLVSAGFTHIWEILQETEDTLFKKEVLAIQEVKEVLLTFGLELLGAPLSPRVRGVLGLPLS